MPNRPLSSNAEAIIKFWLGSADMNPVEFKTQQKLWYDSKTETDNDIRREFESDLTSAERGDLSHWGNTAEGSLALVILLDQFTRNLYRGTPEAYANDVQAQALVVSQLEKDGLQSLNIPALIVFYHPLHHAENLKLQTKAVSLFEEMLEHASDEWCEPIRGNLSSIKSHYAIISKFGRFPHRNKILSRKSTPKECQYLQQDKRTYGQH